MTSKKNIDSISLTDPYGDEITLADTDNLGISYNNENIEPTINGIYRLTIIAGGEKKTVKLNVTSLYAIRNWELDMLTEEYAKSVGMTLDKLLELIGASSIDEAYGILGRMFKQYDYTQTEDYKQSVNENGGFYIARYEASYQNGEVASKVSASIKPSTSTTWTNGMLWNNISQKDALSKSKAMYTSSEFTSSLLTGAAWDRTLGWLQETETVSISEIVINSMTWGNYTYDTFSSKIGLNNTGTYNETEKNHIYDLAGNLSEWTTEAYYTEYRVIRGRIFHKCGSG